MVVDLRNDGTKLYLIVWPELNDVLKNKRKDGEQ